MSKKTSPAQPTPIEADLTKNPEKMSVYFKSFPIALTVVLMGGIAFNGLFHEKNYLDGIMILGLLGILFLGWSFLAKQPIRWRSIPMLLGLGFVLAYSLSLIHAVYMRSAVLALSKYLGVLLLIILIQNIKEKTPLTTHFLKGFYISGVVLAVLGLDGVWGGKLIAMLQSTADAFRSETGREILTKLLIDNGRVASLFHYPNTTAAFLLVAWVIGIAHWRKADQTKLRILLAASASLIGTAFILTLSRGSYLLAVPALILYLVLLPREARLMEAAGLFGTLVTASLLGVFFWPGSPTREMGVLGWGIGLLAAALTSFLLNLLHCKIGTTGPNAASANVAAEPSAQNCKSSKRVWAGILIGCVLLAIAAVSAAWFWTAPIQVNADDEIQIKRIFSLDQPGDYALHIEFAQPPAPADDQGLRFSLMSQTPKEMFVDSSQTLINLSLQDAQSLAAGRYAIPFTLAEARLATETLSIQGTVGDDNRITGLYITQPQTNATVTSLRLSRKLISDAVSDRIESLFMLRSAFKRLSFYGDALAMFRDRPLTGGGGGAWEHLYTSYQDFRYTTSDVHSYPFQLLVEAGMVGALMFLLTLAALAYKLMDLRRKPDAGQLLLWIGAVVLLGHSFIDFDFAYYSILLIFWALVALLDFPAIRPKTNATATGVQRWTAYLLCLALILTAAHWPLRFRLATAQGEAYMEAAEAKKGKATELAIRKAIAQDPLMADYKVALASFLVLRSNGTKEAYEEGARLAAEVRQQADHHFIALEKLSDYYQKSAQWEKAYETESRITALKPLEGKAWEFRGRMIRNALQWYGQTDKVDEAERQKQLEQWLQRGLAIPGEMVTATADKLETVTATPDLEVLLAQWSVQQAELAAK